MQVDIDPDVKAVLEFMQSNIPAVKLRATARGIDELAPLLWGHFDKGDEIALLRLNGVPISPDDRRTQSSASERRPVL